MLVTLSPIVTLVSLLQPENAEDPMLVTLSGIVTLEIGRAAVPPPRADKRQCHLLKPAAT